MAGDPGAALDRTVDAHIKSIRAKLRAACAGAENLIETRRGLEMIIEGASTLFDFKSMQRLAEGEYGICTECGDEIARERLFANPAATRCADCQQFAERTARVARVTRG